MASNQDIFRNRAQNVVSLVRQMGDSSVEQVAAVMKDVHMAAIELVAEDFNDRAKKEMLKESPDHNLYNFCQAQIRHVRTLKSGNRNL